MSDERHPLARAIGVRLQSFRQRQDLQVAYVSKFVGVTPAAYRAWEQGRAIPPTQFLIGLSQVLRVTLYAIFGLPDPRGLDEREQAVMSLFRELRTEPMKDGVVADLRLRVQAESQVMGPPG